ncbi:excinuclease ABC subunit UvrC [Bacteroidota bacterium]|nr:excinuclease ABC subunit UvrC [Bacteroidota bacterium]
MLNDKNLTVQIEVLPENPGVYQFLNKKNEILYIGKAKNIKKRVKSYFTKSHDNNRTRLLVKKIFSIRHIVVDTETDALLLENNLIKEYKPKYNVLLKDDKTYPWICLQKFPPKIFYTRNKNIKNVEYFGPYTSVKHLKILLDLIKEIYPFLNHELNHLLKISNESQSIMMFDTNKKSIKELIKGNLKFSLNHLKKEMVYLSSKERYEEAQLLKDKIISLEKYQSRSTIVNPKINNVDVFSVIDDDSHAYVNFLQIAFGSIIRSHSVEIKKKLNENKKDLLALAIIEIRNLFSLKTDEVYVPFKVNLGEKIRVHVPKLGEKKKLLELSHRNAKFYRIEKINQMKILDPEKHKDRVLEQMKLDLRLKNKPVHIECFDNSNLHGTSPVAACTVFRNGKPSKGEYRLYNIKDVKGIDDFASMKEVVSRRYKRLIDQGEKLPQVVVVDGGKGQLSSALKAIKSLGIEKKISLIGIAKRLEEIFFPEDPIPIYLDKRSETLKIIQQLRNEAHRFGINFHRRKRMKSSFNSYLDGISGVGPKTKELLLGKFKSVKRIKESKVEEFVSLLGKEKGTKIFNLIDK